jgi:uncharacterized DUF497 family protein
MVEFEWDEDKRQINIWKHQIDFLRAQQLFDGRPVVERSSERHLELRTLTTGLIDEKFYTAIWTLREGKVRFISCRRAWNGEERAYRELHGGRD